MIAATSIPVDVPTIVAIVSGLFGGCLVLLKIIRGGDLKRIDALEAENARVVGLANDLTRQVAALEEKILAVDSLKGDMADLRQGAAVASNSLDNLNEKEKACSKVVEKMREDLADARETIMGFGQDFVTRREWREALPRLAALLLLGCLIASWRRP